MSAMPRKIREVPEPWASAMIKVGATDPRNATRPSLNQLAERVGVHTTTITSMVFGERDTDQATVDKVAQVLGIPGRTVALWTGRARAAKEPYDPPAEASLMTTDQRKIVDAVIRQFAAAAPATEVVDPRPSLRSVPDRKAARKGTIRAVEPSEAELPDPDADDMEPR